MNWKSRHRRVFLCPSCNFFNFLVVIYTVLLKNGCVIQKNYKLPLQKASLLIKEQVPF